MGIDNQVDVYFDDVTMTYTPTNVIQYNEYYTHGMPNTNSWTRDNATGNNFLANGGTELNTASSLYDLDYRNYDPILGRMNGVDPMADKYGSLSPYNFSFNMPNMITDPGGADPSPGEPDYVTRRGLQILGPAFYQDNPSSSSQYRLKFGDNANLFDMIWEGGFSNIGGIALGNQAMYDSYSMSTDEYVAKYGTQIYGSNSSSTSLWNPWAGEEVSPGKYSGAWVNFDINILSRIISRGYQVKMSAAILSSGDFMDTYMGKDLQSAQPGIDRFGDVGGFILSMAETPFVIRAGELGLLKAFDKGFKGSYSQAARVLNTWTKGAVTGLKVSTKAFGTAGLVLGAGVATYNVGTGNGKLSDIADMAMIGASAAVLGIVGVSAAPFVAAGGLIYGGVMLFGGEDYINNTSWGKATSDFLKFK